VGRGRSSELIVKAARGERRRKTKKRYNIIFPIVVGTRIGYVHIVMLLDDFRAHRSNNAKVAATVVVFAWAPSRPLATRYTQPISQVVRRPAGSPTETSPRPFPKPAATGGPVIGASTRWSWLRHNTDRGSS
jgi:hypothetical protein